MIDIRSTRDVRADKLREIADAEIAELRDEASLTSRVLGASDMDVADRNVIAGELVLVASGAFVATRNIPHGEALVEGSNVVRTDIVELINQLQKED